MGLFDFLNGDDSARLGMQRSANQMYDRMGNLIDQTREGYETLMADALKPFEEEAAELKKKRGFRDPLAEFAQQSGLRAQQQGASAKAAQATGLRGAGAFAQAQIAEKASAEGYRMETSRRAIEAQRNSDALRQILGQQGQIRGNMGMAQMQAVSGLQSQQIMGHAQMMSQAAQMQNQPNFLTGLLGGVVTSFAGSWADSYFD